MAGRPRGEDVLLQQIPLPPKLHPDQMEQARMVVCSNANDAAEAEMMLAMLGLL